jgi:hypothetical protein
MVADAGLRIYVKRHTKGPPFWYIMCFNLPNSITFVITQDYFAFEIWKMVFVCCFSLLPLPLIVSLMFCYSYIRKAFEFFYEIEDSIRIS